MHNHLHGLPEPPARRMAEHAKEVNQLPFQPIQLQLKESKGDYLHVQGAHNHFLVFLSSLNIVCLCELTVSACAMCLSSDYLCMQPTAATLNE